jgi:hypothetical protein
LKGWISIGIAKRLTSERNMIREFFNLPEESDQSQAHPAKSGCHRNILNMVCLSFYHLSAGHNESILA